MQPLFLLSFGDRDPLAAAISRYGWQVSASRRSDDLEQRFAACAALIAVIDLREHEGEGLKAIENISEASANFGPAILVLGDAGANDKLASLSYAAGATHFAAIDSDYNGLKTAIQFAWRFVERVHGLAKSSINQQPTKSLSFAKGAGDRKVDISPDLREFLGGVDFDKYPVTGIYRYLSAAERMRMRGAFGRLSTGSNQAAVTCLLNAHKAIIHLHDHGERIYARIERTDRALGWGERDLLSGLRNAVSARNWLKVKLGSGETVTLIALGIKNFPAINAEYGRNSGDEILRKIGERLIHYINRDNDIEAMASRIDGQNFVLAIAPSITKQSERNFVEDLLEVVFAQVTTHERKIRLIPRAGIAHGEAGDGENMLLRRATLALAEATASGTIQIQIAESGPDKIALEQRLETDLQQALVSGSINIALQPQIRVDTGQLIGAEALARWNHPEYGHLGAATLFAVAERSGLITTLSGHIRRAALKIGATWPDSLSFLRLSINITASDLATRDFHKQVIEDINAAGFSADRTTLEITETELITNLKGTVEHLISLRKNGVAIAIDDFGTGYSSLSYLKELPLDYLKIDSGLTGDLSGSSKDQIVVRSIIEMARELELRVIAEGVETEAQLASLAEQGCEYFQGFLRSGPLSPEEFELFALNSN